MRENLTVYGFYQFDVDPIWFRMLMRLKFIWRTPRTTYPEISSPKRSLTSQLKWFGTADQTPQSNSGERWNSGSAFGKTLAHAGFVVKPLLHVQ
jgi:hypothetical protein